MEGVRGFSAHPFVVCVGISPSEAFVWLLHLVFCYNTRQGGSVRRMFFNWKGITLVLAAITVVVGLCALDLNCSSGGRGEIPALERVKGELEAGMQVQRTLQADELAKLARDMRVLAKRYVEQGEKRKAQRAIGAAQELDRKIMELRGEK